MADEDDRQRIDELEQEVARLRERLGEGDGERSEPAVDEGGAPIPDRVATPNRTRAIVIAVLVGLLALGGIVAIVTGLSNVIDPLSKEAAKSLAPWEPDPSQKPRGKGTPPRPRPEEPPPEDVPRVPGL
jgi:hypothetical protein